MPGPQPAADAHSAGVGAADPLIGRTLNDRYRIIEQIGSGGMGRVYKAAQAPLDRMVALKVLGAGHDRDPNFYKRFFLEASVTARLTHPNTITLYDYGRTEDGVFFIAMEFLAGRTLSQAMQADGPLAQERVIHIAQQICRSLREAHGLGIIHRDLKPANVMLLRQHDDHDFVKVLDFGLVKFFSGDTADADITNAGTFMGSPHYIAPEQARNQSPDQRCDIYSLGVLLYHMLTGRVPFTAAAPVDIILKHLHDTPVPPRELRPELNIAPELQDIVLRCMAKEPGERFQSMDELLVRLKAVRAQLTGMASDSMPPSGTNPGFPALTPAMIAQTPPTPHPGLRTPSQPMQSMRGAPAGAPHISRPPPPPPDAVDEDELPVHESKPPPFHPASDEPPEEARQGRAARAAWAIAAAAVVALAAGIFWVRSATPGRPQHRTAPPPQPAATAMATPAAAAPAPAPAPAPVEPAPVPVPAAYATANAGTTLVTITSTPSGAAVVDRDDRLVGTTPFDLRVPSDKPLQLTLKHDGYRTYTLKKKVQGEKVSLSVTMKTAKSDGYQTPNRRSVGYKDDPY
ncbi:MAG TPA: serine/threonine-protein kinase [Myxococcales bacterium]|nr:serine/threonine-protein kinase [Myxococcales bacterium]